MRNRLPLAASMLVVIVLSACSEVTETSTTVAVEETTTTTHTRTTVTTRQASVSTTAADVGSISATSQPPDTTAATQGQAGSVELELTFFDWTETNPPSEEAFVVVPGVESWTPDLEFGGDSHSFGDFMIGEPGTVLIYPDGPGGTEISVTFAMTDEMISGSAQALTHIEVFDSEVLVYGQAIPEFEQTFDR